MPLTPEANLTSVSPNFIIYSAIDVLDKFLSLDVVHAMNTRDTISVEPQLDQNLCPTKSCCRHIPDRQYTSGLGETGFLLYTSNSLLQDRRDLCWGGFRVGIASDLV